MNPDQPLRDHVLYLLRGGGAHLSPERVLADIPRGVRGRRVDLIPCTPWQLLEHLRLAQRDILEFSRNFEYESPPWPESYWPETDAPPRLVEWDKSVQGFLEDLEAMASLVEKPGNDLFEPFAHGEGETLLREALLVADHNAYHLGQMVMLRRLLGVWPD